MKAVNPATNRFPLYYEAMIWIVYAGLYKYSLYLDRLSTFLRKESLPPMPKENFPAPGLIFFGVAMTLYMLPYYRRIAPRLLEKKKYGWFAISTIGYIMVVPRLTDWLVTGAAAHLTGEGSLQLFYTSLHQTASARLGRFAGWDLVILLTDLLAFLTVTFIRFGFVNEQKRYQLEMENLHLQLDALKAQLQPHFLFNTLNSLYGMSLAGVPDTPSFILRLSDMMRYILYDCGKSSVDLEKDLAFLDNYIAMEKRRYPEADIVFGMRDDGSVKEVTPLLFIPFVENGFKHGAHRISDEGYIHGHLHVEEGVIRFFLKNNVFPAKEPALYGGVGIANVRQRLNLAYPGRHELELVQTELEFQVSLMIHTIQKKNP
jgi:hypothetical protein